MFPMWKEQRPHYYDSNWLQYVSYARWQEQQNLVAFQYMRSDYYRTYMSILPISQDLVGYRKDPPGKMRIDTSKDKILPLQRDIKSLEYGSLFTSPTTLERHRKYQGDMESDKKHRCHLCSYSTDNVPNLQRHLFTHSGEKPHQCTYCKKAFGRKDKLQIHLLIHTGERPFSCSTCGKDFNHPGNLKIHKRVHTQQKPHRCPHCDYRSSQSNHLRGHIVGKHTKDFRHTCSFCGKGFVTPSAVKKHISSVHSTNGVKNKELCGVPEVEVLKSVVLQNTIQVDVVREKLL